LHFNRRNSLRSCFFLHRPINRNVLVALQNLWRKCSCCGCWESSIISKFYRKLLLACANVILIKAVVEIVAWILCCVVVKVLHLVIVDHLVAGIVTIHFVLHTASQVLLELLIIIYLVNTTYIIFLFILASHHVLTFFFHLVPHVAPVTIVKYRGLIHVKLFIIVFLNGIELRTWKYQRWMALANYV